MRNVSVVEDASKRIYVHILDAGYQVNPRLLDLCLPLTAFYQLPRPCTLYNTFHQAKCATPMIEGEHNTRAHSLIAWNVPSTAKRAFLATSTSCRI